MSTPINTRSVRDQVYDRMLALVLEGNWSPGMRVDPTQTAVDFGVSKTPVQEAIQKLTLEGLLTVKPRSGTFVTDLDMVEIEQVFRFRQALEIGAAQSVLDGLSDDDVSRCEQINAAMRDALTSDRTDARNTFLRLDAQFHNSIIAASGNPVILQHYNQANTLSFSSRARRRFDIADFEATLCDHDRIISALRTRDVLAFRASSARHVDNAIAKLKRVYPLSGRDDPF